MGQVSEASALRAVTPG